MDRDTLTYLLKSGKYLCFNPIDTEDPDTEVVRHHADIGSPAQPEEAMSGADEPEIEDLFDNAYLKGSVFFKEVATDDRTGRLYTSTRVLMAYNSDVPREGGPSFEASPGYLESTSLNILVESRQSSQITIDASSIYLIGRRLSIPSC